MSEFTDYSVRYGYNTYLKTPATGTLTAVAIAAAPGKGKRYRVYGLAFSNGTTGTGTIALLSATTVKFKLPIGSTVGSGFAAVNFPIVECGDNEALNITTTGVGNGLYIHVYYGVS